MQSLRFCIIFVFCFCLKSNLATDTITLAQPITDSEYVISKNNSFKLGFFSPVNTTNRYVAIWDNKIPVRTVVWVANRDIPLADSSGTMMISEDGNLVVLNGQKKIIWTSNVSISSTNSTSAQLSDSGNLVLRNSYNGRTLWESFQYPSDLLMRTMVLSSDASTGEKTMLKSWKSPSDPSVGSFSFGINSSTFPELFIWNGSHPYWRSGPWNLQIFIGIQDMISIYDNTIDVYKKEGNTSVTFNYSVESLSVYYLMNYNGSLMEISWMEGMQEPVVTWSAPQSDCDVYGKCGPFGSCNSRDSPICSCLKGFEPKVAKEWDVGNFTSGCVRSTALQCERNSSSSQDNKQDWFLKLTTMKVPDFADPAPVSEVDCEKECLKNCYCAAYAFYSGIGCMLWNGSLIDIQKFSSGGADLYIRLAYSEQDKKRNIKVVIPISVTIGSLIIAFCAYFSWMWMVKQRGTNKKSEKQLFKKLPHSPEYLSEMSIEDNMNLAKFEELPLFKFEMLAIATDKFNVNNKLGQGGFGPVYKGKLPNGEEIAVKRLSRSSLQGLEEFMNEVVVISKLQHRNLVRLLGCCVEGEEKMLIYEYMPNKSLDAFLFDPHKQELLDWSKRLNIIEGIGRGLLYLHRDSRLKIIHRDLKASNILLDEELSPKISDFGMARIFGGNEDQANTRRVVGTYGYMAPEYAMEGRFSEKSDVFSFGVLLLEIVSGRRNTSFYNDEQSLSLLGYAWKLWNEDNIAALIDPRISYQDLQMKILRCIQIGLLCVQEFAIDRPTISKVFSMLSGEISDLPKPKQPAFTQRQPSSHRESSKQIQNTCSSNDFTVTIIEGR